MIGLKRNNLQLQFYKMPLSNSVKEGSQRFFSGISCILFFLILIYISGCGSHSSGNEKKNPTIRIAVLNGPSAVCIIRMLDRGKLQENNVPLQFIIRSEPGQIKSLMFRHDVDFAFLPSTTAALLYNNGFDFRAVSVPLWGTMFLVGSDSSVHSIRDLKGKSIYQMGRGVVPDIVMRYILRKNGLVPDKDVKINYNYPSHVELANAIRAGIVPLGVLTEPQVSLILKSNNNVRSILDITREWNSITGDSVPFAQTMVVVSDSFSVKYPVLVRSFLSDLSANINWINRHADSAAYLLVKHKILPDSAVAASSIPRCNIRYSFAWDKRKQVMNFFNILFDLNKDVLGGKLPDEKFFYKE